MFMRALLTLLLFLLTTILLAGQSSISITDPHQLTSQRRSDVQSFNLEKLYLTRLIGATAWSPDGTQIAFVSNISGRNNLWLMPTTGRCPIQFTVSNQRQSAPAWSPDGKFIAFMSD